MKNSVQCNSVLPAAWSVHQRLHAFLDQAFFWWKEWLKTEQDENKTCQRADVPICVTSDLPQLSTGSGFYSHVCNPCMASIWWGLLWLESLVSAEGSTDIIAMYLWISKPWSWRRSATVWPEEEWAILGLLL